MLNRKLSTPGGHEERIAALFPGRTHFEGDRPVFQQPLFLIGFTNRSGSNLLAEHMRSTRHFRGFREQLNHDTVASTTEREGYASFPEYVRGVVPADLGSRYFGLKASWDQMLMLFRWRIDRMFPGVNVIHIHRRNVISQAVSFSIADQTKKWSSLHEGIAVEPEYRYEEIQGRIYAIMFANMAIPHITSILGVPTRQVLYETLARDPRPVMQRIGAFAGVDLSRWSPKEPRLQKQAGALNEAFEQRFKADSDRDLLHVGS